MIFSKSSRVSRPLIIASTILSLVATPAVLLADASAPSAVHKKHHRAPAKRHARAKSRAMAKPAMEKPMMEKPMMQEPAPQVAEAPQPVFTPEPAAAPAPTPAPAAPVEVAKRGGGGTILAVLGAAAAIGVIVAVASGGSKSP
jgi:hypothetical protein